MPSARRSCYGLLLLAVLATQARAQQAAASPQSDWGLQGSFGIGGGDKLGFAGTATLGPRYKGNLISVRGTLGQGILSSDGTRSPVWDVGLMYGRRACSPGACFGFAVGPGVAGVMEDSLNTGTLIRHTTGAFLWQLSLQGTISHTASLGLTFVGNRNAHQNFWGLMLGMQFGMPWHGGSSDDEE